MALHTVKLGICINLPSKCESCYDYENLLYTSHSTDAIIQQTIRRELADSTTLTIAHRLNTILDSDRIMVLSAGRIIEFDTPHTLLQNKDSMFSHLVEQVTPGGTGTPETE